MLMLSSQLPPLRSSLAHPGKAGRDGEEGVDVAGQPVHALLAPK
mgnify:CR=1 FL=1